MFLKYSSIAHMVVFFCLHLDLFLLSDFLILTLGDYMWSRESFFLFFNSHTLAIIFGVACGLIL